MDTRHDKPEADTEALPPLAIATWIPSANTACRRALMRLSIEHHPNFKWFNVPISDGGQMIMVESAGDTPPGVVVQALKLVLDEYEEGWAMYGEWSHLAPLPDEWDEWVNETLA